jgi:uncharacterized protein (TIGR02452 family)
MAGGDAMYKRTERQIKNEAIFKDTERLCKSNPLLQDCIQKSGTKRKLYLEKDLINSDISARCAEETKVIVSGKRSLEAAMPYARAGEKVCVLNFASATNPGGGVVHGSSAQEESVCRCSTLYFNLNCPELWEQFYTPHREKGDPLYNDDCIYIPDVVVFKSDSSFPEQLPEKDWYQVNILTCAAPNLRKNPSNNMNPKSGRKAADITEEELAVLLRRRIRRIFEIAAAEGNNVLILGAFGCGAFRNPPEVVAEVFREVQEEYKKVFEVIEYAVYHTDREIRNYKVFKEKLDCL